MSWCVQMGELTNLPDGRVFLCNGAQIGDNCKSYILYAVYTACVYHTCIIHVLPGGAPSLHYSDLPLMHLPIRLGQNCSPSSLEDNTSMFCNTCKEQHMQIL